MFRLILHMDINKCIIMSDISSNRDFSQSLNSILSECVHGSVPYPLFVDGITCKVCHLLLSKFPDLLPLQLHSIVMFVLC